MSEHVTSSASRHYRNPDERRLYHWWALMFASVVLQFTYVAIGLSTSWGDGAYGAVLILPFDVLLIWRMIVLQGRATDALYR